MSKSYETLSALLEKTMALHTSLILFEWDNETLAPEDAGSYTSRVIGILSEEYYSAMTGDEMGEAVAACERDKSLSAVEQARKICDTNTRLFIEVYKLQLDKKVQDDFRKIVLEVIERCAPEARDRIVAELKRRYQLVTALGGTGV